MTGIFSDEAVQRFIVRAIETKARLLATPGQEGSFDCPKCSAKVAVGLVGRKNHVRAVCATEGCLRMME